MSTSPDTARSAREPAPATNSPDSHRDVPLDLGRQTWAHFAVGFRHGFPDRSSVVAPKTSWETVRSSIGSTSSETWGSPCEDSGHNTVWLDRWLAKCRTATSLSGPRGAAPAGDRRHAAVAIQLHATRQPCGHLAASSNEGPVAVRVSSPWPRSHPAESCYPIVESHSSSSGTSGFIVARRRRLLRIPGSRESEISMNQGDRLRG